MARSAHPVDKVVEYFRDAPLEAAETTLRIVGAAVKQRRAGHAPQEISVPAAAGKRRGRKPGSTNKAKPVGRPSAAQAVPESNILSVSSQG